MRGARCKFAQACLVSRLGRSKCTLLLAKGLPRLLEKNINLEHVLDVAVSGSCSRSPQKGTREAVVSGRVEAARYRKRYAGTQ
jgi:hypothetical protein